MSILEKSLRFCMSDGSVWGVPVRVIAMNRAASYAQEFGGDLDKSLTLDTLPLFAQDDQEIIDWAQNNMNWSDVADQVRLLFVSKPVVPKYQTEWLNSPKQIV